MSTRLLLNVAPIRFEDAEIEVGVFASDAPDRLRRLRREFGTTHVFRQEGDRILAVPVVTDAPELTSDTQRVRLSDNLGLCAALVRDTLIRYVAYSLKRPSRKYVPVEVTGGTNLLRNCLEPRQSCPSWLAVRWVYLIELRKMPIDRRRPFLALTLDLKSANSILATCQELLDGGMDLEGLYIGASEPQDDERLAPYLKNLGCVVSREADSLVLTDHRPGFESVTASETRLIPNFTALRHCIEHVFGERSSEVGQRLERLRAEAQAGPGRLKRLQRSLETLRDLKLEMLPGVRIQIGEFLTQQSRCFPTIQTAPKPSYIFDPAGTRTGTWHDGGLDEHGPYTSSTFTPTKPRVCVICQKSKKGQVDQFVHKLLNGIRLSASGRSPFSKGLIRKYALDGVSVQFFVTDDDSPQAYHRAIRQAIQAPEHDGRWDLGLVQIEERFHQLCGDDNPYLIAKSAFLANQVPSQEFEIETANYNDKQLSYSLNNMALAVYAKLGGIPWLVRANPTITHEFIVGLGSAFVGDGRLGHRDRVVGITTVFKADGNYCLSNLSQAVPFDEYRQILLDSLERTITRVSQEMNWQKGEHVRLIFHAFKPLKDDEAEAVKALIAGLGDYDVDYAFIHIVEDHPYVLFNENEQGVRDWESSRTKGVLAPPRGAFLSLSDYEVLLILTGAKEVKNPDGGMPRPILLKLHRNSTFEDMTYLARQVFTFSCHSWRSFLPSPMPVTILYSELVAHKLGEFGTLSRWNPDVMLGRIGKTRWFL